MACKYKSNVWFSGWCDVACMYCTFTQERNCEHNKETNADRIRSTSDEELVGFIRAIYMSEECQIGTLECETCFLKEACAGTYFGKEIEWLKQPAERKNYNKIIKSC